MNIHEIVEQYPNFCFCGTGGGCTAYIHDLYDGPEGRRLMITDTDGSQVPEIEDKEVMCGYYADDNEDGEIEILTIDKVEAWIDRHLALHSKGIEGAIKL